MNNHTNAIASSSSSSSSTQQADLPDLGTIIKNLADDLAEYTVTYAGKGKYLPNVWTAVDILRTIPTDPDASITRKALFEEILTSGAGLMDIDIQEDSQPHSRQVLGSSVRPIIPTPNVDPKPKASYIENPNTRYHPYGATRPKIPQPPNPQRYTPRTTGGMAIRYPNGDYHWMGPYIGTALKEEVNEIIKQAAAENIPMSEIAEPRWNSMPKQYFVPYPNDTFGVWYNEDDDNGAEYKQAIEAYEGKLRKYWLKYPPREGEMESQDEANERFKRDERERYEKRMEAQKSKERALQDASDTEDEHEKKHRPEALGPDPRPTKKRRRNSSEDTPFLSTGSHCSPLTVSRSLPLTPLSESGSEPRICTSSRSPSPISNVQSPVSPVSVPAPIPVPVSIPIPVTPPSPAAPTPSPEPRPTLQRSREPSLSVEIPPPAVAPYDPLSDLSPLTPVPDSSDDSSQCPPPKPSALLPEPEEPPAKKCRSNSPYTFVIPPRPRVPVQYLPPPTESETGSRHPSLEPVAPAPVPVPIPAAPAPVPLPTAPAPVPIPAQGPARARAPRRRRPPMEPTRRSARLQAMAARKNT